MTMLKAQGRQGDVRAVVQTEARAETSPAKSRVWVRPAVAERAACAEIGAYAYQA